jgi:hypothetical protein
MHLRVAVLLGKDDLDEDPSLRPSFADWPLTTKKSVLTRMTQVAKRMVKSECGVSIDPDSYWMYPGSKVNTQMGYINMTFEMPEPSPLTEEGKKCKVMYDHVHVSFVHYLNVTGWTKLQFKVQKEIWEPSVGVEWMSKAGKELPLSKLAPPKPSKPSKPVEPPKPKTKGEVWGAGSLDTMKNPAKLHRQLGNCPRTRTIRDPSNLRCYTLLGKRGAKLFEEWKKWSGINDDPSSSGSSKPTPVGPGVPSKFVDIAENCQEMTDWLTKEKIGRGSYGFIYLACRASDDTECDYVLKIQAANDDFRQEVTALERLQGYGVAPKLYAAWTCKTGGETGPGRAVREAFGGSDEMGYLVIEKLVDCKAQTPQEKTHLYNAVGSMLNTLKRHDWLHVDTHHGNVMCRQVAPDSRYPGGRLTPVLVDFGWAVHKNPKVPDNEDYYDNPLGHMHWGGQLLSWDFLEAAQGRNYQGSFNPRLTEQQRKAYARAMEIWNMATRERLTRAEPSKDAPAGSADSSGCIDMSIHGKTPSERRKSKERLSPSYPANKCKGKICMGKRDPRFSGDRGRARKWISKSDIRGVYRWYKVPE